MHSIIYFSPTGNVSHLAKLLAAQLNTSEEHILPLEFTNAKQLKKSNDLVLLYPIHGFNAPRTVKRFVNTMPPDLFNSVSLIGVGCNTSWVNKAVSSDLRKSFSKKNYPIVTPVVSAGTTVLKII